MAYQGRTGPNRQQRGIARPVPPPVGGWNAKDALDGMKPTDAVILDNWFPRQSDVTVRGGNSVHCNTGEGTFTVHTLAEYKASTTRKFLAGCHGKLINVTTSTPSTVGSGFTNDRWRWVNFSEKLFLVNGSDAPQDWDGTTLTSTAWSGAGLTISNLSDVCVFKERLFFIEKNTLNFWYATTQAITGALTKFPLKYSGSFGGVLKAFGTITTDGGTGQDDLMLFFLSSGEVIVYQGSDPGAAADWSRVGTFFIAPPVGGAPLVQYGSDLVAITDGAYTPLTRVLPFGRTQPSELDLSDKISGAVVAAMKSYRDNTGWQVQFYPRGRMLIFNVPRSTVSFDQHVMNTDTKAWCKFTSWNFAVFGLFNDKLYGGGTDGKVYLCDTGYNDNSAAIVADGQSAWNYFGSSNQLKSFTMARVIFAAVSDPMATMAVGTDFVTTVPTAAVSTATVESGGVWDVAIWDVATWGGATQAVRGWQGISGMGYAASMRLRLSLTSQNVSWLSSTMIFKPAGMV
jgi:hypothetical protein